VGQVMLVFIQNDDSYSAHNVTHYYELALLNMQIEITVSASSPKILYAASQV